MDKIESKEQFIKIVAERARFSQKDVRVILDTIIDVLVEAVIARKEVFVRGWGKLYIQRLPARLGKNGNSLPEADRVIFRLSETIRNAGKEKTPIE